MGSVWQCSVAGERASDEGISDHRRISKRESTATTQHADWQRASASRRAGRQTDRQDRGRRRDTQTTAAQGSMGRMGKGTARAM